MGQESERRSVMLFQELRRRLSQLNTTRIATLNSPKPVSCEVRVSRSLDDILPGCVHEHQRGRLYLAQRKVTNLYPTGASAVRNGICAVRSRGYEPEEALFLDIESCGFSSCTIFLVGLLHLDGEDALVTQLFARDYSEEAALLGYLREMLSGYQTLVTYNGKAFDVPFLRDRMLFHRVECEFDHEHLDLLWEARRRWKGKLPDFRLQTLELSICRRRRANDIPGHIIPELYHEFVRTGNAQLLQRVFHHNALDLITMAELLPAVNST